MRRIIIIIIGVLFFVFFIACSFKMRGVRIDEADFSTEKKRANEVSSGDENEEKKDVSAPKKKDGEKL